MSNGLFITLEGVEGSGKTSHAARLADSLRARDRIVLLTHEPGGTRAGEAIRAIFLDPAVSLQVAAELLLVLADRAQHVVFSLRRQGRIRLLSASWIHNDERVGSEQTHRGGYAPSTDTLCEIRGAYEGRVFPSNSLKAVSGDIKACVTLACI